MSKDFTNLLSGALAGKQSDESGIRERIIEREDLKAFLDPLSKIEFDQLEENILKEGVRDPIIIWPVGESFVLVDGHNRFAICKKHGLEFPFKIISFADEDDIITFMINTQLGRRNVPLEKQRYLRGSRYINQKSQGKRSDLTSGQNVQKSNQETLAATLAKEYNVDPRTIRRDADFAKGIDVIAKTNPELKTKILRGETDINKGDVEMLGKHPEKLETILQPKSTDKIPLKKKLSVEELSQIAFDFVTSEQASPQAFYLQLGKDPENINPLEFFIAWNDHRNANRKKD